MVQTLQLNYQLNNISYFLSWTFSILLLGYILLAMEPISIRRDWISYCFTCLLYVVILINY